MKKLIFVLILISPLTTFAAGLTTPQGGTGTTTWQATAIPYFNGTRLTENKSNFNWSNVGNLLTATNASTTAFSASSVFYSPVTSALLLADANKLVSAASTQTCTNQFFRSLTGAFVVTCATVSLTADVTGTLPIANGGTGQSSFTAGQLLYGPGTATNGIPTVATGTISATSPVTVTAGRSAVGGAAVFAWDFTVGNIWTGLQAFSNAGTTTFSGGVYAGLVAAPYFDATSTATSTAAGGWNITSGCFAIKGTCISGSGGSTNAAGSDKQIQFNDGGTAFGADAGFTIDKTLKAFTTGLSNTASGANSIAMGESNTSSGDTSVAMGENNTASGNYSGALGLNNKTTADFAWSIGHDNINLSRWGSAIGDANKVTAEFGTAIGASSTASALWATAIGASTTASGAGALAMGASTTASGAWSTAFGQLSTSTGDWSLAGGQTSKAIGKWSFAYGLNASAGSAYDMAFGHNAVTTGNGFASIGGNIAYTDGVVTNSYDSIAGPNSSVTGADYSAAFGNGSQALGNNNGSESVFAFGDQVIASSSPSFAAGGFNTNTGRISMGYGLNNSGGFLWGEGANNTTRLLQHSTSDLAFGYKAQTPTFFIGSALGTNGQGSGKVSIGMPLTAAAALFTISQGTNDGGVANFPNIFEISSSTPTATTTLFRVSNIGSTTIIGVINVGGATSSFGTGINLNSGCFAVAGTCISTGGGASLSGGVNSMMAAWTGATTIAPTSTALVANVIATSTTVASTFAAPVGIGSTTPMGNSTNNILSVVGSTTFTGITNHYGSVFCGSGGLYGLGLQGDEWCGNDNTDIGGVQRIVANNNSGNKAWSGLTFNNDKADATLTHFAGDYYNSGSYNSTFFGTAYNVASAFIQQNTEGPLKFFTGTSTLNLSGTQFAQLYISFGTGSTNTTEERMRIIAPGQIGIGTTTPSGGRLTIASSTGPQLALSDGSSGSYAWAMRSSNNLLYVATSTYFATSTTAAITIDGSGSAAPGLFVGTSTNANATIAFAGRGFWSGLTSSAGLQTGIVCLNAANELINESVACVASRRDFKDYIKPLDTGLAELMRLNPVSFYWKPSYNGALQKDANYNGEQVGFIADEVQKLDPRLAVVESDGTTAHGVRYEQMTALIVKAVQEQQQQIENIKQNAQDKWQWIVIALLFLLLCFQQKQIYSLKRYV